VTLPPVAARIASIASNEGRDLLLRSLEICDCDMPHSLPKASSVSCLPVSSRERYSEGHSFEICIISICTSSIKMHDVPFCLIVQCGSFAAWQ
jgi:hypothetical protein